MTRGACELPHQPLQCAVCAHLAGFLHLLGQVFQEGTPPEQQVSDFCEASPMRVRASEQGQERA